MAGKEKHVLNVTARTVDGTAEARRQRRAGLIPAVVYSKGNESKSVAVQATEWEALMKHELNIISLKLDGKEVMVLLKEVQHDFIRNCAMHIDFMEVHKGQVITTSIPVRPGHAEPKGIAMGGMLDQVLHEIEVECTPDNLPESLEVDVSGLDVGGALHVSELVLPKGVKVLNPPGLVVFHVVDPTAQAEKAEAGEATAGGAAEPEVIGAKEKAEKTEGAE